VGAAKDYLIIQWKCAHPSEAGVPRYRVCCPECLTSYVLAAWPNQIRRTQRCASCAQTLRQARRKVWQVEIVPRSS
jgi:hypothetical protein